MKGATWAILLVAVAAVAGVVWWMKKNGAFAPAVAPTPQRPPGGAPYTNPGEFSANAPQSGNIYGDVAELGCQVYTKGQGGRSCELVGRVADSIGGIDLGGGKKLGGEAVKAVATGGLYHPIKYAGVPAAKKIGSTVKGWFS